MSQFFMHLVDDEDVLLDPEGFQASIESVPGLALGAARDCISGSVETGWIDLHYRIEVEDGSGKVVYTQAFKDAVTIRN